MIRSFRHKGLERFYRTGSRKGIRTSHGPRLARQLAALEVACKPEEMDFPGWRLHALKGGLEGHWAIRVSGNWRLTFAFEGEDAVLVDYRDYH
ncbi:MAG: peptidase [Gammaproteobacteria bacterium]|nr:MAG: peptidase [Gammaproteobacteria bacterium]RTZ76868.1 MAG: peptidase [Gammaproteobacteria bacterium]RTZ79367.1 MAG: peptidase [Gammaproteobacteria bacterium]